MANQVQLRKGTSAEHSTFTGALAEITVDTTNKRVILHDSSTAGGIPLAKLSDVTSAALDSAGIKGIIDSNYINSLDAPALNTGVLAGNFLTLGLSNGTGVSVDLSPIATGGIIVLDSADIFSLIDSDYINFRVDYDSANTVGLINSTVDATFINSLVTIFDSADITGLVDSAYVNARVVIPPAGVDSASLIAIIDSDFTTRTTSELTEGTNLYYTDARFDSAFAGKSTTDLSEGTNKYYTDARFDSALGTKTTDNIIQGTVNKYYASSLFDSDFTGKSTTDLSEGTNKYYTKLRVDSDISSYLDSNIGTLTTNTINIGSTVTINSITSTVSTTNETVIDTQSAASGEVGVEYLVKLKDNTSGPSQITKILATYDGGLTGYVEYGTVFTGDSDFGSFAVRESGGDLCLFFTSRNTNNIDLTVIKQFIV